MAEPTPPAASSGRGKGTFGFLARKVGPLPVWAWAGIGVGGYYWYTRYGPGSKKTAAPATAPQAGRTQVVVVQDRIPAPRRRRPPPPKRGTAQPVPQPVQAVAPMTTADVYGSVPTAMPDGSVYQSGYPSEAEMGGAYVPAG